MVLGADHCEGPHGERPEVGRRLLAHIDALAEAGLSIADLPAFAEEAELDRPGALWALTILFGCLNESGAEDAFEAWIDSLDIALFVSYRGIREIAEALVVQPNPTLLRRAPRWATGSSIGLCAIGLEGAAPEQIAQDQLARRIRLDNPIVQVAIERLLARSPKDMPRLLAERPSWMDMTVPALSYEVARVRVLRRDFEPLDRLREGDSRASHALGPYALDLLALGGDDRDLAPDLVRSFPTTPSFLSAMGRVGLPSLFPRLVAELDRDDFDDDAHNALVTALGPRVTRASAQEWEQAIAALPKAAGATRLRGGEPYTLQAVLEEMNRPELSAEDLRVRADEVSVLTGKPIHVDWEAFGVSLDGALSKLARLAR
jgi:hypothetical protein